MDAISCLAPPAALLASSFADAAIARALYFSMSDSAGSSSSAPAQQHSPLLADLAYASAPAPHITCESVLVADSPRRSPGGRRHQLAPAGGRAGKRRSRASKRVPTTYISTDPANFRIMVQQITGVQAEPVSPAEAAAGILPMTFEASLLLAADSTHAGAFGNPLLAAVAPGDVASLHHQLQQQQQPCFPTLDSWNVMYERNELL
ncbi:calmodulin-binding protein 25-like [Phragmites australis]|uniref:calmodulin-binding protein 25-like n=1 Tax=Phragmites australis TaxID=29695 RepID=UPI002D77507E|nr:calmodulin-binding protein 25-like [Phragmites australis]